MPVEVCVGTCYSHPKPWVAKITGTDDQFVFERDFLESRTSTTKTGGAAPERVWDVRGYGLFEVGGSAHDNQFFIVWHDVHKGTRSREVSRDRAIKIARALQDGDEFETIRKATAPRNGIR